MKHLKTIFLALIRTALYLLIRLAELTHWLCRFLWYLLEDQSPEARESVREMAKRLGISHRQAYAKYQEMNGKPERSLEIFANGSPVPSPQSAPESVPFAMRNIGNAL